MKEASTTALFGTMSTSLIKLMMDVKDSSKSSSSMKNGSIPVRGRRGGFSVIRHMLHRGACHTVHFFRVPIQAHGSTRSTHARGGSEGCSALAAPLTLLAQNPGIESSSRASLFEHVAHAGVVGCHRVELAETAAARLARPAVVEGAGWGRLVLSRVHSLLLSNAALKSCELLQRERFRPVRSNFNLHKLLHLLGSGVNNNKSSTSRASSLVKGPTLIGP